MALDGFVWPSVPRKSQGSWLRMAKAGSQREPAFSEGNHVLGAQGEIRTRTPYGAAPSRRCVYQFHHLGEAGSGFLAPLRGFFKATSSTEPPDSRAASSCSAPAPRHRLWRARAPAVRSGLLAAWGPF